MVKVDVVMGTTQSLIATEYETSRPRFIAIAKRYCKNKDDAEDMVQHAFTLALSYAHQYRGQSAISTWLVKIIRNACLDSLRRGRSRPEGYSESLDCNDFPLPVKEANPENRVKALI